MELDYTTVRRVIKGDHNAQTKLLNYYDGYINALSTVMKSNRTVQNVAT